MNYKSERNTMFGLSPRKEIDISLDIFRLGSNIVVQHYSGFELIMITEIRTRRAYRRLRVLSHFFPSI